MRDARPHFIRAAVFGLLALAALVFGSRYIGSLGDKSTGFDSSDGFQVGSAGVLLIAGVVAMRSLAKAVKTALRSHPDDPRGAPVGFIVSAIGYLVVIFSVVKVMGGDLGGLLLGGALTGVVVGIAAQQTLGNFFAGIVLLLVRPFAVGEEIVLRGSTLGGEYRGTVVEMSMFYVHLATTKGPVALPNAGVLAAAVGPGARTDDPQDPEEEPPPAPREGGAPTSDPTPA